MKNSGTQSRLVQGLRRLRGILPQACSEARRRQGAYGPRTDCVACGLCESLCPDFAVYLVEREGEAVG